MSYLFVRVKVVNRISIDLTMMLENKENKEYSCI